MKSLMFAKIAMEDLQPAPIPQAWIVEGAPTARSYMLSQSLDGTTTTNHWDCTAGTFDWNFGPAEETVHIIEGEVHVRDESGAAYTLKAGDVAVFHAGTSARWHVPRYVRKLAICRRPMPAALGLVLRAVKRVKGAVGRRIALAASPIAPALSQLAAFS